MRAHLAAVNGIFFAHLVFDERMAALAHDRLSAELLGNLDRVPGQTRIVNDLAARILL